jgi:hypothetical protein
LNFPTLFTKPFLKDILLSKSRFGGETAKNRIMKPIDADSRLYDFLFYIIIHYNQKVNVCHGAPHGWNVLKNKGKMGILGG